MNTIKVSDDGPAPKKGFFMKRRRTDPRWAVKPVNVEWTTPPKPINRGWHVVRWWQTVPELKG